MRCGSCADASVLYPGSPRSAYVGVRFSYLAPISQAFLSLAISADITAGARSPA